MVAGVAATAAMHQAVAADPTKAGHPSGAFEFDSAIYGHKSVKEALWAAQNDKCAYCEGTFRAFGYGDVEHYRPKGYSQQARGGRKSYPGYYWLAYRWENLLVSCEPCNRARKRNLFPLRDPARRARNDAGLAQEQPLLIDPAGPGDPRDHIKFRDAAPEANTDVGRASIEAYFLDRPYLTAERAKHLREVINLKRIVDLAAQANDLELKKFALEVQTQLHEFVRPDAKFSAMTRDYLGL